MRQTNFTSLVAGGRAAIIVFLADTMSGCTLSGAPSFSVFGAYFPDWMLVAGIWIVAAISARAALLTTGLSEILPVQLLVCVSAGLIVACLVWLVWFSV
jgi:hypothetical protein